MSRLKFTYHAIGEHMSLLPEITLIEFFILRSLLSDNQYGQKIIQESLANLDMYLSMGTLNPALKRLYKNGLIQQVEETSEETLKGGDGNTARRKYFRLSELGLEAVISEVERMEKIVAETKKILSASGLAYFDL